MGVNSEYQGTTDVNLNHTQLVHQSIKESSYAWDKTPAGKWEDSEKTMKDYKAVVISR